MTALTFLPRQQKIQAISTAPMVSQKGNSINSRLREPATCSPLQRNIFKTQRIHPWRSRTCTQVSLRESGNRLHQVYRHHRPIRCRDRGIPYHVWVTPAGQCFRLQNPRHRGWCGEPDVQELQRPVETAHWRPALSGRTQWKFRASQSSPPPRMILVLRSPRTQIPHHFDGRHLQLLTAVTVGAARGGHRVFRQWHSVTR